jgi:hypothetical protein
MQRAIFATKLPIAIRQIRACYRWFNRWWPLAGTDLRILILIVPIADCIEACSNHKDDDGNLDCWLIS